MREAKRRNQEQLRRHYQEVLDSGGIIIGAKGIALVMGISVKELRRLMKK